MQGTAVITGAAGGIGSAFARHLAAEGYDLFLTDKDSTSLEILSDELRHLGVRLRSVPANLSCEQDVDKLLAYVCAENNIQLLVNNAGFGLVCRFQRVNINDVLDMINVHVVATLRLSRAILPQMISGGGGAIINVASIGAFARFPRDASYIASKAYLVAFTECLALDLVGTNVSVQALCPGWVVTDFTQRSLLAKGGYKSPVPEWLHSTPDEVVKSSLRALRRGKVIHIPSMKARLAVFLIASSCVKWFLAFLRRAGMGSKLVAGD